MGSERTRGDIQQEVRPGGVRQDREEIGLNSQSLNRRPPGNRRRMTESRPGARRTADTISPAPDAECLQLRDGAWACASDLGPRERDARAPRLGRPVDARPDRASAMADGLAAAPDPAPAPRGCTAACRWRAGVPAGVPRPVDLRGRGSSRVAAARTTNASAGPPPRPPLRPPRGSVRRRMASRLRPGRIDPAATAVLHASAPGLHRPWPWHAHSGKARSASAS